MNVIRVAGIDHSIANTGWVVIDAFHEDGELTRVQVVESKLVKSETGRPNIERAQHVASGITHLFRGLHPIMHVGMEGYAYDTPLNAAHLGEVGALVKVAVRGELQQWPDVIPPTTVKKFVTGKGNTKKELILKEVYRKWGYDTDNNNLADAYAVARVTLALHGWGGELLTYEKAALEGMKNGK